LSYLFDFMKGERIILGIDPGTQVMGYGLIADKGKKIELITLDVFKFSYKEDQTLRLKKIFESVLNLIDKYHPDELAIEAPFFGKNVQSMLKLGRAQGVAMAAGLFRNIPIFEYSPRKIKQSITGNGNSSKEQVAGMLGNLLVMGNEPKLMDATDAVAVAVCHYFQREPDAAGKNYNGWKNFLDQNPDRMAKK
jgi:crossover junction endodeoxyribonuclease RuvC